MEKAPIHQIIYLFKRAFADLNVQIRDKELEDFALLIHSAMLGARRKFHTPEHVLSVCQNLHHPLQILGGLFHDVIYYQVDGGFPEIVEDFLEGIIKLKREDIFIQKTPRTEQDEILRMCLDVFGFQFEQKLLVYNGLNEFLSAYIAGKSLEKFLPNAQILCILACIEATIPFRTTNEKGLSHFEQLAQKLQYTNQKYALKLSDIHIEHYTQLAVGVANEDVANFAGKDTGRFLDNTWLLIFEANKNLFAKFSGFVSSILQYRHGIMKTEGFIKNLKPESVFHQYKNIPDDAHFQYLQQQATINLAIAKEYLGVKLLTATLLEALAHTTGGDVPISVFTGGIRTEENLVERAEDYLPACLENTIYNDQVFKLLAYGRASDVGFDMKNSPLSAFIYKSLGSKRCMELLENARDFFSEKIYYHEFLTNFDAPVLSAIAQACAKIAITRAEALEKYF